MKPIKVPDFGINYSVTYKDANTNSFRPAATAEKIKDAISGLKNEYIEENDMLNPTCDYDDTGKKKILFLPVEKSKDSLWYINQRKKLFSLMYKIKSYNGNFYEKAMVLVPSDLIYFKKEINLGKKEEIHWSTSGGVAHDKLLSKAIAKGISEVIENDQKMRWWFGRKKLLKLKNILLHQKIMKSNIVKDSSTYLVDGFNKTGAFVCISIVKTLDFPNVSIGCSADYNLKRAAQHSVMEALNYYRGTNWYALKDSKVKYHYLKKNKDITELLDNSTILQEDINYIPNLLNKEQIMDNNDFYFKILSNDNGYTVKVFNVEAQPLISTKYVPFIDEKLYTHKNIELRKKYNGSPFE